MFKLKSTRSENWKWSTIRKCPFIYPNRCAIPCAGNTWGRGRQWCPRRTWSIFTLAGTTQGPINEIFVDLSINYEFALFVDGMTQCYVITMRSTLKNQGASLLVIFTARNEVRARLYFHRRVWFCSQGGGVGIPACTEADPPRSRHSPGTRRPPPGPDTPPGAEHSTRYGQCAGGTHPTGMQSC